VVVVGSAEVVLGSVVTVVRPPAFEVTRVVEVKVPVPALGGSEGGEATGTRVEVVSGFAGTNIGSRTPMDWEELKEIDCTDVPLP
jgi:hypothetical protein